MMTEGLDSERKVNYDIGMYDGSQYLLFEAGIEECNRDHDRGDSWRMIASEPTRDRVIVSSPSITS